MFCLNSSQIIRWKMQSSPPAIPTLLIREENFSMSQFFTENISYWEPSNSFWRHFTCDFRIRRCRCLLHSFATHFVTIHVLCREQVNKLHHKVDTGDADCLQHEVLHEALIHHHGPLQLLPQPLNTRHIATGDSLYQPRLQLGPRLWLWDVCCKSVHQGRGIKPQVKTSNELTGSVTTPSVPNSKQY